MNNLIITMKLVFMVKVYWLFIVYIMSMLCCPVRHIVYVMLSSFMNRMFNFRINNVVEKPIINKYLFYISKFIKEDNSR